VLELIVLETQLDRTDGEKLPVVLCQLCWQSPTRQAKRTSAWHTLHVCVAHGCTGTSASVSTSSHSIVSHVENPDNNEDIWQSLFDARQTAAEQEADEDAHSSADELELLTEQVDKYLGMALQIRTGDPLVWWREHATDLPQLARLA